MATYDHLPVYKTSYDLILELFQTANSFSRDYRFTIGEKIKNETMEMIICIYRANKSFVERGKHIGEAREKVETIRFLLRVLKDLKQLGFKKFVYLNEKVESVSKQLSLWEAKNKIKYGPEPSFAETKAGAPLPVQ
ncbi:four helix bundle protein [Patescibacteria group bacterium]|nr:four helix bundle protein [Patescibacteria group bacterium]